MTKNPEPMKKNSITRFILKSSISLILSFFLLFIGCKKEKSVKEETFGVAFLTDIHLQPEKKAVEGLTQALDSVNNLKPDFIITGGDLIMDALGVSYGRADSLYRLYQETIKKSNSPVYNTMGNHEIYGIYDKAEADPEGEEYGEKMFEKRFGESYYAFEHKGWKFFIINSIEDTHNNGYTGLVDEEQLKWIKTELEKTDRSTPLVISTHIPFISVFTQRYQGSTVANNPGIIVENSKEVLDLFADHNLKLVLQGHLHALEDIEIDGIHFITVGAVCGGWWNGPNKTYEEGFAYLEFTEDSFSWRYVDYGWELNDTNLILAP